MKTTFPFGSQSRWLPQYARVGELAPGPGGRKIPNRWGFFDMLGNLWEACWERRPGPTEGGGLEAGATEDRAHGGAYDSGIFDCHAGASYRAAWNSKMLTLRILCAPRAIAP